MDDAEHRRDDAERREAVGHRLECMNRLEAIVAQGLDLLVHQGLDLMAARVADDDEPAVVANESDEIHVLEKIRERLEDFRFLRVLEVVLDLAARLSLQFAHQGVEDAEKVEEIARLRALVEDRLAERLAAIL